MIPRRLLALGLFALLALGCPEEQTPPKEVAGDLARWMKSLKEWEPEQQQIFTAIGKVNQEQYVEEDFVAAKLKETLPILRSHNRKVAAFKAETKELEPVVRLFRKGWDDLELSFHALIAAAEAEDSIRLAKARSQMEYARGEILGAFASLDELLELNDLYLRMERRRQEARGTPVAERDGGEEAAEPAP